MGRDEGARGGEESDRREGEVGRQEQHGKDDDEDPPGDRSCASPRLALERPPVALAPRESGLHQWPHDSIGGVNGRKVAPRLVETARRVDL